MVIDASAIVAILVGEPEGPRLSDILETCDISARITHAISVYEAVLALSRIYGCTIDEANRKVMKFVTVTGMQLEPLTAVHGQLALAASAKFGKGKGKAKLNMGDCFSYACAKLANDSILFVGNDFAHTDLDPAH